MIQRIISKLKLIRFRLLAEYHSFLFLGEGELYKKFSKEFPSPYGVSFILIEEMANRYANEINSFPSPYVVSFILIYSQKSLLLSYVFSVLS